jgi:TRAP-type C4-dicarboxylate transport system substrate-binding protein
MRKTVAFILAMTMSLSLAACGGSSTGSSSAASSTAASAASESAESAKDAAPDKVYELKVSTTQAETAPIVQGLQAIADRVAEDTKGGVKITIYPSSQLARKRI